MYYNTLICSEVGMVLISITIIIRKLIKNYTWDISDCNKLNDEKKYFNYEQQSLS